MLRALGKIALAAAIFAIVSVPSTARAQTPTPTPQDVEALYQHSLDQYEHGDYAESAKNLKEVIDDAPPGFARDKLKRAWLYRGISLYLTNDKPGAEKAFWQVLILDKDFRPDPLFTLPAIIACFDQVRADHAADLRDTGHHLPDTQRDPLGVPLTNDPNQRNFVEAISPVLPFGYAQYKNRQPGKALALGITEGTLVLAITGTYVSFQTLRKPGDHFHPDEIGAARLDKTVNNAAYLLLAGELVYGAIDGVYYSSSGRRGPPRGPVLTPGPGTAGVGVELRF